MATPTTTTPNDDPPQFPEVQPGGSLMIAWQAKGKRILVVGGGEVAAGRILLSLNASALVTVICPTSGLSPEVTHRIALHQVTHHDRLFLPSDLDTADLVLCAVDDPAASSAIWRLCRARRIPANIADVPAECDFYFGSVHRDGPLQVMVSTNGKGPRLASTIRKYIGARLPVGAGRAIETVGALRVKLRAVAPRVEDGGKRMRWMTRVSDAYSWEEMCGLTEEDMGNLLRYYESGRVPSLDVLKAMRGGKDVSELDVFDGSFGFSVGV
ncbi:putative siroheme synthase Met8 [Schizothecium vesticola]|uniref:precorrin-2 dehydrogenase n=1 Tax=Schizothecium vesticola TaxID=314040 RepID=A0AA40EXG7_9PEZI|nr:putative siroheme synthase Met8 [Schizothecium vesticola]